MPLLLRRFFFYSLLAAFLIIAPIIIGYTMGYRWSFTQKRLVKTGALSLATIPDNATIILNGEEQKQRTPILIRELTPGSYAITLKKDGYSNWQKTLQVESEKTTFAINVTLFKQASPTPVQDISQIPNPPDYALLPPRFKQFSIFHDNKLDIVAVVDNSAQKRVAQLSGSRAIWREDPTPLLFAYSPHEIWQFNPQDGSRTLITRLIEEIQTIIPLPKQETLILVMKNRVRALELDQRDRQNSWDIAQFDEIKNAALSADGKMFFIEGTHEGKDGVWTLEL